MRYTMLLLQHHMYVIMYTTYPQASSNRLGDLHHTTFNKNVDGAMHFIYSHKYNTNSAEDSFDMN